MEKQKNTHNKRYDDYNLDPWALGPLDEPLDPWTDPWTLRPLDGPLEPWTLGPLDGPLDPWIKGPKVQEPKAKNE